MSVRLFCLMILGFTISAWSMVPEFKYLPDLAKLGMHLFYAAASGMLAYGIVTGRAPS